MKKLSTFFICITLSYGALPLSYDRFEPIPPPPLHASVDWYNPTEIIHYVETVYGEFGKFINWVIKKESSFNPFARNGNFVGLMQMGPAASKAVGYDYNDVKTYPWINIEAGAKYLQTYCLPKANGNQKEAYRRYNLGPWYDSPKNQK